MAKSTEAERVKTWTDRVISANKLYNKWADELDIKRLEEYYKGRQWRGVPEEDAKKLYVINLIYSSVEVNKPSLIFYRPQIRMQPRPSRNDPGSMIEMRAKLCEDTVQSFIDDPDMEFAPETALALHEAHFSFGVIEVGYSANWTDNPDAGRPILKEDEKTPITDKNGQPIPQPDSMITEEQLYVKRIPSNTFRVSISNCNSLSRNDWCGYYEWHYAEDLKNNPYYQNTSQLKATGVITDSLRPADDTDDKDVERHHGMVKIWKIWDLRGKKKLVIAENHKKFLLEEPFKYHPFAIVKFHEVLDSFYPLPPVSQWMDPQDEINETREAQRAHRRRFFRRYTYLKGSIEEGELQKMMTGGDGVCVETLTPDPLQPVQDAPMGSDVWQNLDASKLDLLGVTGIGGDQRGVAESETATQANIIDSRSRLRESSARTKVADWLSAIARLMLLTIRDNMALPFWIKRNVDPFAADASPEGAAETQMIAQHWQEITNEELGDTDMEVFVELASMSPVTEDVQRASWNQVLALLTNPQLLMILAMSEVILRKTLTLYGVRTENEIREIKKVIEMVLLAQQQAQMMEAGAEGGAMGMPGAGGGVAAGEGEPIQTTPAGDVQPPPELNAETGGLPLA